MSNTVLALLLHIHYNWLEVKIRCHGGFWSLTWTSTNHKPVFRYVMVLNKKIGPFYTNFFLFYIMHLQTSTVMFSHFRSFHLKCDKCERELKVSSTAVQAPYLREAHWLHGSEPLHCVVSVSEVQSFTLKITTEAQIFKGMNCKKNEHLYLRIYYKA